MADSAWTPLLDRRLGEQATAAVRDISRALAASAPEQLTLESDASLSSGHAGIAVFHGYRALAADDDHELALCEARVDLAMDALAQSPLTAELFDGFSGIGWALQHIVTTVYAGESHDELAPIDEAVLAKMNTERWDEPYDLISGLVGLGVYAVERRSNRGVGRVLDHLEALAVDDDTGTAWFTEPRLLPEWQREQAPAGYYNLGLAHGVPGVIALLADAIANDLCADRARALLRRAVSWLLAHKLPPTSESTFSSWLARPDQRGTAEQGASRLGWCYGDVGIAMALLAAAQAMNDAEWRQEAIALLRRASVRVPGDNRVFDSGFCHGTAGLAHMFNRAYQATGDQALGEAARGWFARLLRERQPDRGIAGFPSFQPDGDEPIWVDEAGLLTGSAGVGLVLLAATTAIEPGWDRYVLTKLGGKGRG